MHYSIQLRPFIIFTLIYLSAISEEFSVTTDFNAVGIKIKHFWKSTGLW